MLNHNHKAPKKTHVVSNLGAELQAVLLFATSNLALLFEDIGLKVSMKMRRIHRGSVAGAVLRRYERKHDQLVGCSDIVWSEVDRNTIFMLLTFQV